MNTEVRKTAVLTGAAGGIGQAIVAILCEQGYNIALLDRDEPSLTRLITRFHAHNSRLKIYPVDVTNERQVTETMTRIVNDFGRLDILVNNAGILNDGLLIKAKEGKITSRFALDDWKSVIDINLTGVFLCGREAAAQMAELGHGGVIINMTSLARRGNFGQSSYSAAKAGVEALTVTWAQELAKYNIRSAGIAPGVIETRMTAGMKPEALDALCKRVPSGRLGKPEEVASAVMFIIDNPYFNGRIVELDGGLRF